MPFLRCRATCLALALLALPLAIACGDDSILGPEDVTYASELGVDLDQMRKLEGGVYVGDVMPGFGSYAIDAADSVQMHYKLWLPDGTELQEGDFALRLNQLIPGFRQGATGMTKGGVRMIIVPPELGYGANPQPNSGIPPNAVLVFRAELLDVLKMGAGS